MSKFYLYTSNRLEVLAILFREFILKKPLENPFEKEIVAVQTKGMDIWLRQELSKNGAVVANFEMPFIRGFINGMLVDILKKMPQKDIPKGYNDLQEWFDKDIKYFSPEQATWRIFEILQTSQDKWPELTTYIRDNSSNDDNHIRKRFQLAERIANFYDQYQLYRGEILEQWQEGKGTDQNSYKWQRELYQELAKIRKNQEPDEDHKNQESDKYHKNLFSWYKDFMKIQLSDLMELSNLPKRVSLFGFSSMAPLHLDFIHRLSHVIDVHFFYLNHCREYWGENPRQMFVTNHLYNPDNLDQIETHNALLDAFGAQGRIFFAQLMNIIGEKNVEVIELFCSNRTTGSSDGTPPVKQTRLQEIQESILTLSNTAPIVLKETKYDYLLKQVPNDSCIKNSDNKNTDNKVKNSDNQDRSIQIHSCHTIRRELEVLKDELIRLFNQGEILPHDVIVMTPDINTYEPYIQAVFNDSIFKGKFSISDRSIRRENQIANAFLQLLELATSRLEVSSVLNLLSSTAIHKKFNIADEELETLSELINLSSIRWGFNAQDRKDNCKISFREFSWQWGFDRLLLGFSMLNPSQRLVGMDLLPCGNTEGDDAELLGRFIKFVDEVKNLGEKIRGERKNAENWAKLFQENIDKFFLSDQESVAEIKTLHDSIELFAYNARVIEPETILFPLAVAIEQLSTSLDNTQNVLPFLRQGITFCSMMPLRSIPRKVIALLGLNEGEFPRKEVQHGFSVLQDRKLGDPSRSREDRYLFLEALLSARHTLMLFYHGKDPHTLEELQPAIPLAELIDVLNPPQIQGKTSDSKVEVINHPLQSFDTRYFNGDENAKLHSYSKEYYEVAKSLSEFFRNPQDAPQRFWTLSDESKKLLEKLEHELDEFKINGQISISPFSDDPEMPEIINISELYRAFTCHPEYFMKNRAGMRITSFSDQEDEDTEPVELDVLESYSLRTQLLNWRFSDDPKLGWEDPNDRNNEAKDTLAYKLLKEDGKLPLGNIGNQKYQEISQSLKEAQVGDDIFKLLNNNEEFKLYNLTELPPKSIELLCKRQNHSITPDTDINGITITGSVQLAITEQGCNQVFVHGAGQKSKTLLKMRLGHLLLTLWKGEAVHSVGFFLKPDKKTGEFPLVMLYGPKPDKAKEQLKAMLEIFRVGLYTPLPISDWFYQKDIESAIKELEENKQHIKSGYDSFCKCFQVTDFLEPSVDNGTKGKEIPLAKIARCCAETIYPVVAS